MQWLRASLHSWQQLFDLLPIGREVSSSPAHPFQPAHPNPAPWTTHPVLAQVVHAAADVARLPVRLPEGWRVCGGTKASSERAQGHGFGEGKVPTLPRAVPPKLVMWPARLPPSQRSHGASLSWNSVPVYITCVLGSVWNPTTWYLHSVAGGREGRRWEDRQAVACLPRSRLKRAQQAEMSAACPPRKLQAAI